MPTIYLMLKDKVVTVKQIEKTVTTVGRAPGNDVAIDNLAVSSFHARIVNDNGVYVVEDLNSTNGTFVNGRRVSRVPLSDNDVVMVGKHSLVFSDIRAVADADVTTSGRRGGREATVMIGSRAPAAGGKTPPAASAKEMPLGVFAVVKGSVEQQEHELAARSTTIGKSWSAQIRLRGFFAPRMAALITRQRDGYTISPASGWCKVRVNGVRIKGRALLKDGDLVDVRKVQLRFYLKD